MVQEAQAQQGNDVTTSTENTGEKPDSLLSFDPATAKDTTTEQTTTSEEDVSTSTEQDPFGDLDKYRDEDSNLYLGKYKTPADAFEGYKELSRRLREKSPEAPAEGYVGIKLDGDDVPEVLRGSEINTETDPMFKRFETVFKEIGLSQEQVSRLVKEHAVFGVESAPDLETVKTALGQDGDVMLSNIESWVGRNGKHLDEDMQTAMLEWGQNAGSIKLMNFIVSQAGEKPLPKNPGSQTGESWQDLEAQAFKLKEHENFDVSRGMKEKYEAMMNRAQEIKLGR